ncbi:hypothetical protein MKW98_022367 [Papaver atlanticum]|uniref:Cytochrome P450 n=1 Tax=Papaver atlanticum TaxID=357466 RepID=A0AAD4XJ62_9MAGN|nr:hypothetical protein MKW98_022367 [Papaver atlanticum]
MDDLLLKIYMVLLSALVFLLSLYSLKFFQSILIKTKQHEGTTAVEPPGTTGWPIIGETLDFGRANLKGFPEKFFYDRVRKYSSKVFKTSLIGETVTVLDGPAGNKFLFSNEYKLVTIWWPRAIQKIIPITEGVASPSGIQASKNLRQKIYPLILKRDALRKYVDMMDSLTRKHFDTHWDNKEEVIVYPLVQIYTFSMACWFLLSVDDECLVHELLKPFNVVVDGFASLPINLPGTPLNRGIKASKFIRNEFEKIVKQRMNQMHLFGEGEEKETILPQPPAKDMLSQMIMFSDNNPEDDEANVTDDHNNQNKKKFMSATYIADLILCLMAAGYHTTSTVITVLMKFLADFPDVLNGVLLEQNEVAKTKAPGELLNLDDIYKMKYSWNVICEVLRLAPPFQGGFTEALTDFTYAGYFIPKGRKLYWTGISSHMNPENFPDPEKFDPSRFQGKGPAPYTFIPFGGGAGMCPGYEYARVEILVFLHHVVRRYKWEKLIPGNINERLKVNPYPLPPKGFPIRLQPRTT